MIKITVTGIRNLHKALEVEGDRQKKALQTAIKVEGYRLLRQFREEIKKGVPGGHPYAHELSVIARRTQRGLPKKNQIPLYRLARLLRYNVAFVDGDMQLSFGFVSNRKNKMSGSWKALLIKHQEGVSTLYQGSRTELGRRFARIGGKLKKKDDPDAKYFFLRRTTGRNIKLPERPMTEPFWLSNQVEARNNITRNFKRKMKGKRI